MQYNMVQQAVRVLYIITLLDGIGCYLSSIISLGAQLLDLARHPGDVPGPLWQGQQSSRVRVDTAVVRHGSVLDCRDGRSKLLNASDQPMSRAKIEDCFVSKNPRPRPPPLACATSRRGEGSYPHELVAMCGMPVATSDACLATSGLCGHTRRRHSS